jgi:hypothetical protein
VVVAADRVIYSWLAILELYQALRMVIGNSCGMNYGPESRLDCLQYSGTLRNRTLADRMLTLKLARDGEYFDLSTPTTENHDG